MQAAHGVACGMVAGAIGVKYSATRCGRIDIAWNARRPLDVKRVPHFQRMDHGLA